MPNKFTEHFNLNLWDTTDKVHHDDFNADNLKLDAALAGKLGQLELIRLNKGSSLNSGGISHSASSIKWGDWSCVCMLVHYSEFTTGSRTLELTIYNQQYEEKVISPLALPGYLVVFLPMHDASQPVGGLVFTDRFYSFSADFSYQEMVSFWVAPQGGTISSPSVAFFGAK